MGLYLVSAIIILIYFTILFAIACWKQNYAIADIGWGAGFILIALASAFSTAQHTPLEFIVTILVLLWGSRLTIYIYLRNKNKPEDFRYHQLREKWGRAANLHAYVKLYLVQAFIMWLVSLPIIIAAYSADHKFSIYAWLFVISAVLGFLYESISDYQLMQFKKLAKNHGKILMNGLWKYSRHPNYFGEIVFWWSLSLLVMISTGNYLALISGLTMNILIIYVSGVPMLEEKYRKNPTYRHYIDTTGAILPKPRFK